MRRFSSVALLAVTSLALSGCGGGSATPAISSLAGSNISITPTPSPTSEPTPAPMPTPTTAVAPTGEAVVGTNTTQGFPQLERIPSNFTVDDQLVTAPVMPSSAAPDVVGAFRFLCKPSHLAYDDPIVFPGQKGRSHLHMFFGNTSTDANSTYESLRTEGESTCRGPLNRSAYWVPALMNGQGDVVMPEYISIYYKRYPSTDPRCAEGKGCIGLPRGLRYVFGRTMDGDVAGAEGRTYFNCQGEGAVAGKYTNLVEAAQNCPSGALIAAIVQAPDCWNGTDLDSADHRSHMAYEVRDSNTGVASCPTTHPYRVPTFTLGAWYQTDDTLDRSGNTDPSLKTWHFSSDRMEGQVGRTSGQTFHADWFGAWDDDVMATWLTNCIDLMLSCSAGELGNGEQMAQSNAHLATFDRRVSLATLGAN